MTVIIPQLEQRQATVLIAGLALTLRTLAEEHKKVLDQSDPQAYRDLTTKILAGIRTGFLQGLGTDEEKLILNSLHDLSLEALTLL